MLSWLDGHSFILLLYFPKKFFVKYIDLIYFVDLLSLSDRSISREVYRAKYITIKML